MTTSSLQYRPEPLVRREMAWRHIQEAFFIGRLWGYSRSSRAYSNLALFAQAAGGIWPAGHAHSLHAASVIGYSFWLPLGVDFRYAEAGISGSSFVLGESVCLLPWTVPFYFFSFNFFALYWCVLTRRRREGWPRARWTRRRTGTCVSTGRWTALNREEVAHWKISSVTRKNTGPPVTDTMRRWAGYNLYTTLYKLSTPHLTSPHKGTCKTPSSRCLIQNFRPDLTSESPAPSPTLLELSVYFYMGAFCVYYHTILNVLIKLDKLALCTSFHIIQLLIQNLDFFIHTEKVC